mgnify:CR=1 FL=1
MTADTSPTATPICVTIRQACEMTGLSRSSIYRALQAGDLVGRKYSNRTLIEVASLRDLMGSLPIAEFKPGPSVASAA